jgi:glycosyltransferase involved in cell wall biosynthesis
MAPHKGIETLVDAVADLYRRHGRVARLALVGAWPDRRYEERIRAQVDRLGLRSFVEFEGHVPRVALLREYARAKVFALLSQCESFGIPGAEAQAFGTPVVCSDAGAMSEIYGRGARVVPIGDPGSAADALEAVLCDETYWLHLAAEARSNAQRYSPGGGGVPMELLREVVTRKVEKT